MAQAAQFVISEFTNPSGEIVFRVTGWLDGKRIRKNFPSRAEASAERQALEIQRLQAETGIRTTATRLANALQATSAGKVAAWFLDTDYDGKVFCICQAFFPDKTAWDKLARALKTSVAEGAFEALSGTTSLPFKPGPRQCVAVKVIDPRGNEVMRVHRLDGKYPQGGEE
jgi:hypothetical protein